jgi:hypothetical protein
MQESDGYRRSELRAIVSIGFIAIDALLRSDESNILDKIQSVHLVACHEACATFGGWVFRHEVNGIWCSFATANLALKALDYILNRLHSQIPQIRCGVHVGDVTLTPDGELLGHTLSVAKRLETQARLEEVCLSHESYDRLDRNVIELFDWCDLGDTELKGVGHLGVWTASRRQSKASEISPASIDDSGIGKVCALFDFRYSLQVVRRDILRQLFKSLPKGAVLSWGRDHVRALGSLDRLLEMVRPWVGQFRMALLCHEGNDFAGWPTAHRLAFATLKAGHEPLILLDSRLESSLTRKPEVYFAHSELKLNRIELVSAQSLKLAAQDPFASDFSGSASSVSSLGPKGSALPLSPRSTTSTIKIQAIRLTPPEDEFTLCLPVQIELPTATWKATAQRHHLLVQDLPSELQSALKQPELMRNKVWTVSLDLIVRTDSYGKVKNSANLNRWQTVMPILEDCYAWLTELVKSKRAPASGASLAIGLASEDQNHRETPDFVGVYRLSGQPVSRDVLVSKPQQQEEPDPLQTEHLPSNRAEPCHRPYQGWNAYSGEMDVWFFGRESLCTKVAASLQELPWLVVYGRTGVGKTSFLRAGLYTELAQSHDHWIWVSRWSAPSFTLVAQLDSIVGSTSQSSPAKAVRLAAQQTTGRLYLVFDQFEEFFLDTEASERSRFTASLYSLMSSIVDDWESWGKRVRIIFSLREDRLPEFSALESNLPGLLNCLHRIRPFTSDEARDAIQRPAVLAGIKLSESLIETLVEDLGADAVSPNELSLCLHRLWLDYLERQSALVENSLSKQSLRYTSGEFHDDIQKSDYWRLGGASEILETALIDSVEHLVSRSAASEGTRFQLRDSMLRILQSFVQVHSNSLMKRTPYRRYSSLLAESIGEQDLQGLQFLIAAGLLQYVGAEPSKLGPGDALEQSETLHGTYPAVSGDGEVRLAQDSMLNEINNWVQNEQLSQRYAQLSLAEEHQSWQNQGTSMTSERFHLIEHYREALVIGESERSMLLETAALFQESLQTWLKPGDADLLLKLAGSPIDGPKPVQNKIRRHMLISLLRLPLTDPQIEEALILAGQVGHPDWLDQLAEYDEYVLQSSHFWEQLRQRVSERFFGSESMCEVSAGAFWFGSTSENKADRKSGVPRFLHESIASESNLQQLDLGEFLMDRYPVTHDLFSEFRPSHIDRYPDEMGSHPVVSVSFYDALDFAKWLGKELPNEYEWEKASRGCDARLYPWGSQFSPELANSRASQRRRSSSVLAHPGGVSPYGCQDMAGNVWEWTSSDFGHDTPFKVQKGGSCINSCEMLQCSSRREAFPDFVLELVGFRLKAAKGLHPLAGRGRYSK